MNVTNLTNMIYITFHLVISTTSIVTSMHTSHRSCIDALIQSIMRKISDICHYLTIHNVMMILILIRTAVISILPKHICPTQK